MKCENDYCDADALTLTTKESSSIANSTHRVHLKATDVSKVTYRDEDFSDTFDAAPSEISESTFGTCINFSQKNNLLVPKSSAVLASEVNSENDSKTSNSTMETPTSNVPASVTSSEDPVDFMRSVESRSSYKVLLAGKSLNKDIDDEEELLPKALDDEMDAVDQVRFCSPEAPKVRNGDSGLQESFEFRNQTISSKNNRDRSVRKEMNVQEMALSCMHNGDVKGVKALVANYGVDIFSSVDATKLLLQLAANVKVLPDPISSFVILLDVFKADVNAADGDGRTALHHVILHSQLGSLLLMRGADILLCDDSGTCPLSLSFNHNQEWLLHQFEASGREAHLLQQGSTYELFRYTTYLILAGHSSRASMVISLARVVITPDDATALMSSCTGNFENMKEPVETFELLESLGARIDEI